MSRKYNIRNIKEPLLQAWMILGVNATGNTGGPHIEDVNDAQYLTDLAWEDTFKDARERLTEDGLKMLDECYALMTGETT